MSNTGKARGFPSEWRAIIEPELSEAKIPMRTLLDASVRGRVYQVRKRIWRRINGELGVRPLPIARRFGFHHTTVLYALGRLGRQNK